MTSRAVPRVVPRWLWLLADVLVGLVAAALCWPTRSGVPTGGLDPGWRWLLARAAREHVRFGVDFVFTYGPLGWLFEPVAPSAGQLVASTVVTAVVLTAGFAALSRLLSARLPRLVAAVLVLALASQLLVGVPELSAALLTCVLLARVTTSDRPLGLGTVAGVAVTAGVLVTTKTGVGSLAVAAAAVLAVGVGLTGSRAGGTGTGTGTVGRARVVAGRVLGALVVAGVATTVGLVAAWLLVGQRLGDLVPFLRTSQQVQVGYQSAMTYEQAGRAWEWPAVTVALVLLVLAGVLSCTAAAPRDRPRVVVAGLVGLGVVYYLLLQAFVRHGGTHDVSGQQAAVVVVAGLLGGWGAVRRRVGTGRARGAGAGTGRARRAVLASVVAGAVWVATCAASTGGIAMPDIARDRVWALRTDLRQISQPAGRVAVDAAGYARLRATVALPPAVRAALGTGPVTPVPWAVTEVVAAGFGLRTLPVPQTYSAYTDALDELNADALTASDGPPTVLRQYTLAIDQRNPMWESPRASLALLCHFREVVVEGGYQVLRRGPQACALGTGVLATTTVPAGASPPVTIPSPLRAGDGVVLSVAPQWDAVDALRRRLVRQRGFVLVGGGRRSFRIVPDTADGPLVLRVPDGVWSGRTLTTQDQKVLRFRSPVPLRVTFRELDRTP